MAIPLTINGQTFEYPVVFDENWGIQATGWAQAVTVGMLQRAGGNFPLTADANFGTSFGLIAEYYKSAVANIATVGTIRLANAQSISWRNDANTGNLPLAVDSMDQLTYNGLPIAGGGGAVTAIIGTANQIIASSPSGVVTLSMPQDINVTSTVTFGQIIDSGLSASELVVTNGSKQLASLASPSLTEVGYLTGVTSGIQAQLGAISSQLPNYLLLTGGTLSGSLIANAGIAMGSTKITGLANGTAAADAVNYGQLKILQYIQYTSIADALVSSSTFTAVPLSGAIVPSSASNKVRITVTGNITAPASASDNIYVTLLRDGTNVAGVAGLSSALNSSSVSRMVVPCSICFVDSPSAASSVTYAVAMRDDAGTFAQWNVQSTTCVMILEELQ